MNTGLSGSEAGTGLAEGPKQEPFLGLNHLQCACLSLHDFFVTGIMAAYNTIAEVFLRGIVGVCVYGFHDYLFLSLLKSTGSEIPLLAMVIFYTRPGNITAVYPNI